MVAKFFHSIKERLPGARDKIKAVAADKRVAQVAGAAAKGAGWVQEKGTDALDTLTRKSTDEEVREHILLQSRYNDIVALKLDEALRRIDALERRVNKE